MSFATFGVAYFARPVGAFVIGHFGDRIGRQNVLMFTLVLMGLSTFAIGCLPTYAHGRRPRAHPAGAVPPAAGLLGRRRAGRRQLADAGALARSPARLLHLVDADRHPGRPDPGLARGHPVRRAARRRQLYSWGWRVPFWLSAVVVVVAYFIRRRLHETPEFAEAKAAGTIAKMPLMPLLRDHWRDVLRVIFCAFIAAVSTVFANLAIAYGKKVGLHADITLWLVVVANIVALGTQPLFGMLADRIGRKPVFIYGALSSAVLMPFYMLSMSSGNDVLTFVLAVATFSFGYAAANAVWPSFYGEMFSTEVRFSGLAIGTQLGFLVAGFAPTIVTALGGDPGRRLGRHQRLHRRRLPHRRRCRADRPRDQGRADRAAGPQGAGFGAGTRRPLRPTAMAPCSSEQAADAARRDLQGAEQSLAVALEATAPRPRSRPTTLSSDC